MAVAEGSGGGPSLSSRDLLYYNLLKDAPVPVPVIITIIFMEYAVTWFNVLYNSLFFRHFIFILENLALIRFMEYAVTWFNVLNNWLFFRHFIFILENLALIRFMEYAVTWFNVLNNWLFF